MTKGFPTFFLPFKWFNNFVWLWEESSEAAADQSFFLSFLLQLQFCVVYFRLHSGGFCHRLSGSLGTNIPLQSSRLHWGESSLWWGPVCLLRQVTYMWFYCSVPIIWKRAASWCIMAVSLLTVWFLEPSPASQVSWAWLAVCGPVGGWGRGRPEPTRWSVLLVCCSQHLSSTWPSSLLRPAPSPHTWVLILNIQENLIVIFSNTKTTVASPLKCQVLR